MKLTLICPLLEHHNMQILCGCQTCFHAMTSNHRFHTTGILCDVIRYTGCPRRNVPNFGRVFLMLKYTHITQNTYPKLNGYGDNGQRKVWSSCGFTYCTRSADTLPVHCACPSLRVSLLPKLRLHYERFVTCTASAVQSEREVVHMYTPSHVPCKVLGTLRTTAALMRVFM
jgi:hypothetical protein